MPTSNTTPATKCGQSRALVGGKARATKVPVLPYCPAVPAEQPPPPAAPSAEQPPSAKPDFDTVFRQVREIGGWLTEAQAAHLVAARRERPAGRPDRRDRQPPGPLDGGAGRRRAAGPAGGDRPVRGRRDVRRPGHPGEVHGQPGTHRDGRAGRAAAGQEHRVAAELDRTDRLSLHRWQARLLDAVGRPAVERVPGPRRSAVYPRRVLLDRGHARPAAARAAPARGCAIWTGTARWPGSRWCWRPHR